MCTFPDEVILQHEMWPIWLSPTLLSHSDGPGAFRSGRREKPGSDTMYLCVKVCGGLKVNWERMRLRPDDERCKMSRSHSDAVRPTLSNPFSATTTSLVSHASGLHHSPCSRDNTIDGFRSIRSGRGWHRFPPPQFCFD